MFHMLCACDSWGPISFGAFTLALAKDSGWVPTCLLVGSHVFDSSIFCLRKLSEYSEQEARSFHN